MSGLSDTGRVRLIRFLLQNCRTGFGLNHDRIYLAGVRNLVDEFSERPGVIKPCAWLDDTIFLATGSVATASLGSAPKAVVVSDLGVIETVVPPSIQQAATGEGDHHPLHVALGAAALSPDARIVVFGSAGAAVRKIDTHHSPRERLVEWLAGAGRGRTAIRDFALDCLTTIGKTSESARASIREIMLLDQTVTDGRGAPPLGCRLDCGVAAGNTLFVSGSLSDPARLIEAIEVKAGDWSAEISRSSLVLFSAESQPIGFAALAVGNKPAPLCGTAHLTMRLVSGARIEASCLPILHSGGEARKAILNAVPSAAVTDILVAQVLGPALERIEDVTGGTATDQGDVVEFGSRQPGSRTSLVIPVAGNRELFATRLVAFAAGMAGDDVNAVFVLTSHRAYAITERILTAAHRRFGLRTRLVVCPPDIGREDLLNCAARVADSERLIFIGAHCTPQDSGSISRLSAALDAVDGRAVVGGIVLNADESIREAGYAPSADGRLTVPEKGFPWRMLDSEPARQVFACSSEFLAVRSDTFAAAGGFSTTYFSRAWRDADFCLRARPLAGEVRLEPSARVVRFASENEAPATPHETLARRLNAWRFTHSWSREVAFWSATGDGNTPMPDPPGIEGVAHITPIRRSKRAA